MYGRAKAALLSAMVVAGAAVITAVVGFVMASPTFGWTGASPIRQPLLPAAAPDRSPVPRPHLDELFDLFAACNRYRHGQEHVRVRMLWWYYCQMCMAAGTPDAIWRK